MTLFKASANTTYCLVWALMCISAGAQDVEAPYPRFGQVVLLCSFKGRL